DPWKSRAWSVRNGGQVHPAALMPALVARFGELHTHGAGSEIPREVAFPVKVLDEELPLDTEGVFVGRRFGNALPVAVEVHGFGDVEAPGAARCVLLALRPAASKAGDGGAIGAV